MPMPPPSNWIDPRRTIARSPAAVYLASISQGSRRTMHQSLASLATMIVEICVREDGANRQEPAIASDGSNPLSTFSVSQAGVDPMRLRWENLRRADTVRLRVELRGRYAPSTANKMLSALRGVLRTCRNMKLMNEAEFQAAASLELIKSPAPSQHSSPAAPGTQVTRAVVRQLFTGCSKDHTAAGRRDAALLTIFLSSGLRRAEAAIINVADFDRKTGRLHIRGDRPEYDRLVTLGPPAKRAMKDWLDIRSYEPGPLLLPVDRGGIIRFRRLTDQAIYDIFSRIATRANVQGVTLRDLRRAYVISLIRAGKPIEEVQYLIGHASWFTTTAYGELSAKGNFDEGYDVANLPYPPDEGETQ